jgi:hypothetical protein
MERHQIQFYDNDFSLLAENVNTIQRNIETVLYANKEVSLEMKRREI